ncbi:MAG TPA: type II toxin-antitoxin system PemK/MazF family toxin [Acidimicrobiales bacterium]|nr:type II toxin-antitoxin system PemK/MazF family toxin [Acidimicrobiales bacterium]
MLTSGDVVDLDLGIPHGSEAGFRHPAVVVTAQASLRRGAAVVQIVPTTSTIRGEHSEVVIEPDRLNGLDRPSAAQCQHIRGVSSARIADVRGNVGPVVLAQVRDRLAVLLGLPV